MRSSDLLASLGEAWAVLRHQGVRVFWFRALAYTVYRRLVLLEQPLGLTTRQTDCREPIEIGLLEPSGLAEYVAFRPDCEVNEIKRRLDAGNLCFLARLNGCIVSADWTATGRAWQEYLSREIVLAPDEVYLYDLFTSPSHRGRGISSALDAAVAQHYSEAGYRRMLRLVWPENDVSVRMARRAGCRPCGLMGFVKIGPWRRQFHHRVAGD